MSSSSTGTKILVDTEKIKHSFWEIAETLYPAMKQYIDKYLAEADKSIPTNSEEPEKVSPVESEGIKPVLQDEENPADLNDENQDETYEEKPVFLGGGKQYEFVEKEAVDPVENETEEPNKEKLDKTNEEKPVVPDEEEAVETDGEETVDLVENEPIDKPPFIYLYDLIKFLYPEYSKFLDTCNVETVPIL